MCCVCEGAMCVFMCVCVCGFVLLCLCVLCRSDVVVCVFAYVVVVCMSCVYMFASFLYLSGCVSVIHLCVCMFYIYV